MTKRSYYYISNILDVFGRYSVGGMLTERESDNLTEELIAVTCVRQNLQPGQLTIYADCGSRMPSKSVADLGMTKTHSRPHVSNHNP